MLRYRFLEALALAAAIAAYGLAAQAQTYPARPIRIILPIGAGGVADPMVRLLGDRIAPSLGQGFILDHRPGAGGNIGMEAVARSAPDGYTLLLNGPGTAINPTLYRKLSFDPLKDLVPVAMIAGATFAVFVSGKLPVRNVAEFIAYAKTRPGKLNYASVGVGTAAHLSSVLFSLAAGLEMIHVPYKSIQQAVPDLVSGNVHMVFNAYPPLAPMLQDDRLKLLGFAALKRMSGYPAIPLLAETGLPGFEASGWYLLAVPAGTPLEIQQRLNTEFARALNHPETRDALIKLGLEPMPMGLEDTQSYFAKEVEKWGRAVKASGASAD